MNFSNPILICDENEEFRLLLRDMLTKNGFFHVIEASSDAEAHAYLRGRSEYLVLVGGTLARGPLLSELQSQRDFVVFSDPAGADAPTLAVRLGVAHVMSYPVYSRKLLEKLNSLI
jgi:CheY-like chemotaxis protein